MQYACIIHFNPLIGMSLSVSPFSVPPSFSIFPSSSFSSPLPLPLLPLSKAGMCETMITNPVEIVKIRLQVAGEMGGVRVSAVHVVKELGFRGLYKVCG